MNLINLENIFKIKKHPVSDAYRSISYRWNNIWNIPEFAILEKCEQNPKWHSEGNVKNHTMLVCKHAIKEIIKFSEDKDVEHNVFNIAKDFDEYETCYLEPSVFEKALTLLTAALFHDIGKGVTTSMGKDGNWHSYGHENEGEKLTRLLLWEERLTFRENVCSLVKYHMIPLNIFERKNYVESIINLSYNIPSWELLLMLKRCDLEGSIQKDEILKERDRIMLNNIKNICEEIRCYHTSPRHYFNDRVPSHEKYLNIQYKKPINIFVMIGIPGAGKDTYINNALIQDKKSEIEYIHPMNISKFGDTQRGVLKTVNKNNSVMISRDIIRYELGFCKEDDKKVLSKKQEDAVSKEFKERLYNAAKEGKNIIINNINLKKDYRLEYQRLLSNYDVYVTYIYVEATSLDKNIERRSGQIGEDVLKTIIKKFDWPEYNEYDSFYYVIT